MVNTSTDSRRDSGSSQARHVVVTSMSVGGSGSAAHADLIRTTARSRGRTVRIRSRLALHLGFHPRDVNR